MPEDVLREVDKVFVVACGTAFHAGLVAKYAIEHWTRAPGRDRDRQRVPLPRPGARPDTLTLGVSQSGETIDTLEAVRHARRQESHVARHHQHGRLLDRPRGRRRAVHARRPRDRRGGTKTFATQMVALDLVALYLAQVRGTMFPEEIAEVRRPAGGAPRQVERALGLDAQVRELAERYQAPATSCSSGATPATRPRWRAR